MELGTIATVTTGHLTGEVAKLLDQRFESKQEHPDTQHWSNRLLWASFEYGYLLSIGSGRFDENSEEFKEEFGDGETPKCILEIAAYAKKRGVKWLCFDQDGPEVEGIAIYDW